MISKILMFKEGYPINMMVKWGIKSIHEINFQRWLSKKLLYSTLSGFFHESGHWQIQYYNSLKLIKPIGPPTSSNSANHPTNWNFGRNRIYSFLFIQFLFPKLKYIRASQALHALQNKTKMKASVNLKYRYAFLFNNKKTGYAEKHFCFS